MGWCGVTQDGVSSIKRCVQNNFADVHRQQVRAPKGPSPLPSLPLQYCWCRALALPARYGCFVASLRGSWFGCFIVRLMCCCHIARLLMSCCFIPRLLCIEPHRMCGTYEAGLGSEGVGVVAPCQVAPCACHAGGFRPVVAACGLVFRFSLWGCF